MKHNKAILAVILLAFLFNLTIFAHLPDKIPLHWNFRGEVDSYGSKYMSFMFPAWMLVIYLGMMYLPRFDPKREAYTKHAKAYEVIRASIIFFLFTLYVASMVFALGYPVKIDMVTRIGIGVLLIVLGNYMAQIRHNYFFGIKLPWTLADEDVWRKTHRFGGFLFVGIGLAVVFTLPFPGLVGFVVLLGGLALGTVALVLYSYWIYQQKTRLS